MFRINNFLCINQFIEANRYCNALTSCSTSFQTSPFTAVAVSPIFLNLRA